MLDRTQDVSDPQFWDTRYAQGSTPWDLGTAPAALRTLVEDLGPQSSEVPTRVLCPGAGRGHDALAWARAGFETVAVDMAPRAISAAADLAVRERLGIELLQRDLFALPATHRDMFDIVWEQTCLCAIDPERRAAYVETMASVLKPGGQLFALLWNHGKEGGPPWNLTEHSARELLESHFDVDSVAVVTSGARSGEFLVRAHLRAE